MSPTSYQTAPPRVASITVPEGPGSAPAGVLLLRDDGDAVGEKEGGRFVDVIDRYEEAATGFTARLDVVTDDQWTNPTPGADWNVRQLVARVLDELANGPIDARRRVRPLVVGHDVESGGETRRGLLVAVDDVHEASPSFSPTASPSSRRSKTPAGADPGPSGTVMLATRGGAVW